MSFEEFRDKIKWRKWGKYLITIVVFLVVYIFVGDQSMINFAKRAREIRKYEKQRDMYVAGSDKAQQEMQALHNQDSLEQFAREKYLMHAPNEDIYLVEEE
ncbi:MAG: septum formation initiator family protein [Paludibacteraceae bacterium]|nr:septum formation initiator family protein [Paludibacteraceae bacterium]